MLFSTNVVLAPVKKHTHSKIDTHIPTHKQPLFSQRASSHVYLPKRNHYWNHRNDHIWPWSFLWWECSLWNHLNHWHCCAVAKGLGGWWWEKGDCHYSLLCDWWHLLWGFSLIMWHGMPMFTMVFLSWSLTFLLSWVKAKPSAENSIIVEGVQRQYSSVLQNLNMMTSPQRRQGERTILREMNSTMKIRNILIN